MAKFQKKKKRKKKQFRIPKLKAIGKAITPAAVASGLRQSVIATIFTSMITELARIGREKRKRRKKK